MFRVLRVVTHLFFFRFQVAKKCRHGKALHIHGPVEYKTLSNFQASKPNERWTDVAFFSFWKVSSPAYVVVFKMTWLFSFWSLLDKSFHFVCFAQKNCNLSVFHLFYLIFQKLTLFCLKSHVLVGNRQTTKISKKN